MEESVTRTYMLSQNISHVDAFRAAGHEGSDPSGASVQKQRGVEARKAFFSENFGVSFPEGSSLDYHAPLYRLTMTNTPANHERLRVGMATNAMLPVMVQLQFRILSFEADLIDDLERKHPNGIPDAVIVERWMNGEGETLESQSIKTMNGINTIIECVEEHIYPTVAGTRKVEDGIEEIAAYSELKTRETGMILNITPTVNTTGRIYMVILPEQAESMGSALEEHPELAPLTPLFQSLNLTTSVVVTPGVPLVIGNARSIDGQSALYVVGSAQLVETNGDVVEIPHLHQ